MPRPIRIEYEDAYYHVMNRGRGRQKIFHSEEYYNAFLKTLEEAHQRFGIQVLCYCLMGNHYHLLVKTPEANLGRAMRHINGVYTQRHNRLKKTDGTLFRGRYKAVLVEEDSYQLQLSRYIHRNPLETKLVKQLEAYPWSSYPYYVTSKRAPAWLDCRDIYEQLSVKRQLRKRYQAYVEMGVDEEIAAFYGKGNQAPYLGSDEFRDWAYLQRQTTETDVTEKELRAFRPTIEQIAQSVADHFGVKVDTIQTAERGNNAENIPRWVAMHLAQGVCGLKLRRIADYMGLKRIGGIPTTISKLKLKMDSDHKLTKLVEKIKRKNDT